MDYLRDAKRRFRIAFRVAFIVLNNIYCIPTFVLWMVSLRPLLWLVPSLYWRVEGLLFHWLLAMVASWSWMAGYDIMESGDDITSCVGHRCLILANHQSTADVPLLMAAWNARPHVLPHIMWIMDKVFKYTNFGACSVIHEDFFILSGKDHRDESLGQLDIHMVKSYLARERHFAVLFPEGGFLRKRKPVSHRFALKNNLPLLEYVALPRSGALKTIFDRAGPFAGLKPAIAKKSALSIASEIDSNKDITNKQLTEEKASKVEKSYLCDPKPATASAIKHCITYSTKGKEFEANQDTDKTLLESRFDLSPSSITGISSDIAQTPIPQQVTNASDDLNANSTSVTKAEAVSSDNEPTRTLTDISTPTLYGRNMRNALINTRKEFKDPENHTSKAINDDLSSAIGQSDGLTCESNNVKKFVSLNDDPNAGAKIVNHARVEETTDSGKTLLEPIAKVSETSTVRNRLQVTSEEHKNNTEKLKNVVQKPMEKPTPEFNITCRAPCSKIPRNKIQWIVDTTIAYPNQDPLDLPTIVTGRRPPCKTNIFYRIFPSTDIPTDEDDVTNWLYELFYQKEKMLEEFYRTGCFPRVCPDGRQRDNTPRLVRQDALRFFILNIFFISSTFLHLSMIKCFVSAAIAYIFV